MLLVFGILQLLIDSTILHSFFESNLSASAQSLLSPMLMVRIFIWPLISMAEALVYWLIRRRNSFRALSWAHIVIYILAFLLNIFFATVMGMYFRNTDSASEYRINRLIRMHEQQYIFWALVILAHLAFVAMLANCLRKPELVATKGDGRENILDDVIL